MAGEAVTEPTAGLAPEPPVEGEGLVAEGDADIAAVQVQPRELKRTARIKTGRGYGGGVGASRIT